MIPDWALKYKKPGCTIKEYSGKYYLYYATSKYVPGKKYPVSIQTYIGRILPDGVVSERVSIDISKTGAATLGALVTDIPEGLKSIILLYVKGSWYFTKMDNDTKNELEKRGLIKDGKLNICNIQQTK